MKNKVVKEIISWILVFVLAFGLALFINKVIIYKVKVPSGSMETTIMTGDKVLTYRLAYLFGEPKRGDIVVFPFPDDESQDYIKRIIGLPGETIEGKEGVVYINGDPIDEPYINNHEDTSEESTFGPYTIPDGCYFMMGDNRSISADARYWENKFVTKDKIIGKALLRYPDFKWLSKTVDYKLKQDKE
jgi:signal peptidase I